MSEELKPDIKYYEKTPETSELHSQLELQLSNVINSFYAEAVLKKHDPNMVGAIVESVISQASALIAVKRNIPKEIFVVQSGIDYDAMVQTSQEYENKDRLD